MNISEASRLWLEFVKEGREWCDFPGKKEIVSQLTEQGKHFVLLFPKQRKQPMLHGISLCLQTKCHLISKMQYVPLIRVGQMGGASILPDPTQLSSAGQMGSSLTLPLPFLVTIYHSLQSLIIFHMYISVFFQFQCGIVFKTALSSISFVCQVEGNLILCSQTSVRFIFLGCDKTWPFNFTLLFWELAIQES